MNQFLLVQFSLYRRPQFLINHTEMMNSYQSTQKNLRADSGISRSTSYKYYKNYSPHQFINRFNKVSTYNAIHSINKEKQKRIIEVPVTKKKLHSEMKNKVQLFKLFTSTDINDQKKSKINLRTMESQKKWGKLKYSRSKRMSRGSVNTSQKKLGIINLGKHRDSVEKALQNASNITSKNKVNVAYQKPISKEQIKYASALVLDLLRFRERRSHKQSFKNLNIERQIRQAKERDSQNFHAEETNEKPLVQKYKSFSKKQTLVTEISNRPSQIEFDEKFEQILQGVLSNNRHKTVSNLTIFEIAKRYYENRQLLKESRKNQPEKGLHLLENLLTQQKNPIKTAQNPINTFDKYDQSKSYAKWLRTQKDLSSVQSGKILNGDMKYSQNCVFTHGDCVEYKKIQKKNKGPGFDLKRKKSIRLNQDKQNRDLQQLRQIQQQQDAEFTPW